MQSVRASHDDFSALFLSRSPDRNSWCGFWVLLARFRFTFFVRQTTDICKITGPFRWFDLNQIFSVLSKCLKHQIFWHIDWCQDWWVYYDANHAISLPPGCVLLLLPPTTTGPGSWAPPQSRYRCVTDYVCTIITFTPIPLFHMLMIFSVCVAQQTHLYNVSV